MDSLMKIRKAGGGELMSGIKIGTLNEQPLHSALKNYYAGDSGEKEVRVDGYIIDVVNNCEFYEIQTGNFSTIKRKVSQITPKHRLTVVYPIAVEKWIVKLPEKTRGEVKRRKSPKKEGVYQLFKELVSFPDYINHQNFFIDVVKIQEEELRKYTGEKTWRQNGWVTLERRLLNVLEIQRFSDRQSFYCLLPEALPKAFTTKDLANLVQIPRWLAQKAVYCLRKMHAVKIISKKGRANLYQRS